MPVWRDDECRRHIQIIVFLKTPDVGTRGFCLDNKSKQHIALFILCGPISVYFAGNSISSKEMRKINF